MYQTRSRDLIWQLLGKFKIKHRDPKLFYLTMDVVISKTETPVTRTLLLDDKARPAELSSCNPWHTGPKLGRIPAFCQKLPVAKKGDILFRNYRQ